MISVRTNAAGLLAARVFSASARDLDIVTNRIAAGQKVSGALDDASSFSIAQGIRAEIKAYSAVQQSLRGLSGVIGVAVAGATAIVEQIGVLKQKAVDYASADTDRKAIVQADIDALLEQIDLLANAATFNGINLINATQSDLLVGAPADEGVDLTINGIGSNSHTIGTDAGSIVVSFTASGSGGGSFRLVYDGATVDSVALGGVTAGSLSFVFPGTPSDSITLQRVGGPNKDVTYSFDFTGSIDFGVEGEMKALSDPNGEQIDVISLSLLSADLGIGGIDYSNTAGALAALDAAQSHALRFLGYLGARHRSVDLALERADTFVAALSEGLGNIVDADLARDSARQVAAQVHQGLARENLAIANGRPRVVLQLLR